MNRILKKIGAVAVVAALAFSLTACGKKTCSICGKEFSSGGSTTKLGDVEISICGDCLKLAGNLGS